MDTLLKVIRFVVAFLGSLVVVCLLVGYPTMRLMNYLFSSAALQAVFGVAKMTFWRAFSLDILCWILFKSISIHRSSKK